MMARGIVEGFGSRRSLIVVGGFLAALIAAGLLLVVTARPAHAATFTVNSTGDDSDANFINDSPNVCDTDLSTPGLQCTLRAAIQEANNTPGTDTINFNIPGDGPHTIAPSSKLPSISLGSVIIDGYS